MVAWRAMADDYHLDCSSGIAGDMFLGACLDLGMALEVLEDAVSTLGLPGVALEARRATRGGIAGTRFRVLLDGRPLEGADPEEASEPSVGTAHSHASSAAQHPYPERDPAIDIAESAHHHQHAGEPHRHRDLAQIRRLLLASGLTPAVRERALALFARLGEAEAKAHGVPLERVHFHEVGAVDSIVDLVGAAAAREHLAPRRLTCSAVNVGSGRVRTAHGELPVPAPATAELLRGVPVYGGAGGELTTPTGAALLAELVDGYCDLPPMVLEATGYGLGKKHLPQQPNVLRLLRGGPHAAVMGPAEPLVAPDAPRVTVVECEVDDLSGEGFGFLMERLLGAGALDVYFTPVVMKKSRPGTLVSLLCRPEQLAPLAGLLLLESGSLGCRYYMATRLEAERDSLAVDTRFGSVRVKRGRFAGGPVAMAPEYEDCRRLALAAHVSWREVYNATIAAMGALPAGASS
jgi:pyridinium-3,5-bisthiocarboxylic acid mononucleotide nickel chelatase